jgi:murein DD-endopeptidase MepM/ murein hydrolase activator NlpD
MVHLQEGSIKVKIGDEVTAGQPIAKAGNSGMTLYPHLHIQATRGHWLYGRAVPILFDNRFLMKNGLVIKKP